MRLEVIDADKCVGCQGCMFACTRIHKDAGLSKTCIKIRSNGGMERGFMVVTCIACDDPPCARSCPEDALVVRENGGVTLNKSRCIGCGNCVKSCIVKAIFWDDENNKPLICRYCGYCARYCPYGVIELRGKSKKDNVKILMEGSE